MFRNLQIVILSPSLVILSEAKDLQFFAQGKLREEARHLGCRIHAEILRRPSERDSPG